jgi:Tol biopolymer transport system component
MLTVAAVLVSAGSAAAAPRYTDWREVTYFTAVNTDALEFANAISKDGLTFYFQRGNALSTVKEEKEDIWITQRANEDSNWSEPTKLPATVNSDANDRAAFESPDGHWLFFASDRAGSFDLYDAKGWQHATKLDALSTAGFDSGPTVFEDPLTGTLHMYFVSNPKGPQGPAVDVYESIQDANGTWGTASKVDALNSPANEGRPYVSHSGLEIFFNSARAGGPGPQNIWFSTRESLDAQWSTAQLAPGVNTLAIQITPVLSWDGRTLYFASSRSGSNGEIYYATRQKVTGRP